MFEDYLKKLHDKQYEGTGGKDKLVEDYEFWISALSKDEIIVLANDFAITFIH